MITTIHGSTEVRRNFYRSSEKSFVHDKFIVPLEHRSSPPNARLPAFLRRRTARMYIRNGQSTGPSNDHRDRGLSISYIRPRKVARYVHREQLTQAGMNGSRRPVATVTRGIASTYCRVHDRESVNSPRFASFPLPFEL